MKEHAALNQRVWDWITRRGWSRRRVAREAGIKEATFGRMLDDATYQTDPENWRRLARYLGWDEVDVLAQAGIGPPPPPLEEDVATVIGRLLTRAGYAEEDRAFILDLVRRCAPVPASNNVSS
jgi:hypothetical protein